MVHHGALISAKVCSICIMAVFCGGVCLSTSEVARRAKHASPNPSSGVGRHRLSEALKSLPGRAALMRALAISTLLRNRRHIAEEAMKLK